KVDFEDKHDTPSKQDCDWKNIVQFLGLDFPEIYLTSEGDIKLTQSMAILKIPGEKTWEGCSGPRKDR
ncbi:hypothetical protein NPIL_283451, partial [Nephila pilipes]